MKVSRGLVLVFAVASASSATAQNSEGAEKLFVQGKDLMNLGRFAEACTAFEDSQRLAAAITTEMNIANCREKNDQLASAHEMFMGIAKELEGKPESKKLREVALQRAATLQPRLSTLTLVVPSASQVRGLQIQVDSRSITVAQWNQPIALDGGTYKLIARAEDRIEWTTTIALAPSRDTKTIEVPTLPDAHRPPPPRPAASGGSLKLPIIFGVAALGLGGAALGLELAGRSKYQESEDATSDRDLQLTLLDEANARHVPAQIAGIAALGCATAAVILFITRDKPSEIEIMPVLDDKSVGLSAFASW